MTDRWEWCDLVGFSDATAGIFISVPPGFKKLLGTEENLNNPLLVADLLNI